MLTPQPCGACGEPVPAGPGRKRGQVWWHKSAACQRHGHLDQCARKKARDRRYRLAWNRAARRLAGEYPGRMAELVAEETERLMAAEEVPC